MEILVYRLDIPNVFTPNGDGINDVFTIKSPLVTNLKGEIYDRWGTKVYEWHSSSGGGWDGRNAFTGMPCGEGTYYYLITMTDVNGKSTLLKSYFQLIR